MSGLRWALVILAVALVIGLIAYARGPDHRRGDEVGEEASGTPVIRIAE
jgi:hypothetical protein